MARVTRCDRCGKSTEDSVFKYVADQYSACSADRAAVVLIPELTAEDNRRILWDKDLCPTCLNELQKWFNDGEKSTKEVRGGHGISKWYKDRAKSEDK